MSNTINIEAFSDAVAELLDNYQTTVIERVDVASESAVKELVTLTKATAPTGNRGKYRKNIASKEVTRNNAKNRGKTFAWYVKSPDYRLTHLLVHGHATRNGGRTRANPFLQNAIDTVTPKYIRDVEEALQNGG